MLWILLACNTDKTTTTEEDIVEDTAQNTENDTEEDVVDTETDTNTDTDTDTDTGETEEPEPAQIVRFVALGDGGEGNETQYKVAEAMKTLCDSKTDDLLDGCEFALYLGDNIYDIGVESVLDEQFYDKFEAPYANIDFPFYVVLGNHDAGCWGAGCEFYKTEYEVDYTNYSDKWTMFDQYYRVDIEHITLFGLDTNELMWEPWFGADDQWAWFESEIPNTNEWTIAFGHHPYVSNGRHGNAGSYEGLDWLEGTWGTEVPLGQGVKEFMDANVCGQVDVYFAGHDHNRQWLDPVCGTEFIVSGAAAKHTDLEGRGNQTMFEDDMFGGFMWIEIEDNCFTGEFYNENGFMEFTHQFCK